MNYSAVLYVTPVAKGDSVNITPHDGIEPDSAVAPHADITDDGSVIGQPAVFAKLRFYAPDRFDKCHRAKISRKRKKGVLVISTPFSYRALTLHLLVDFVTHFIHPILNVVKRFFGVFFHLVEVVTAGPLYFIVRVHQVATLIFQLVYRFLAFALLFPAFVFNVRLSCVELLVYLIQLIRNAVAQLALVTIAVSIISVISVIPVFVAITHPVIVTITHAIIIPTIIVSHPVIVLAIVVTTVIAPAIFITSLVPTVIASAIVIPTVIIPIVLLVIAITVVAVTISVPHPVVVPVIPRPVSVIPVVITIVPITHPVVVATVVPVVVRISAIAVVVLIPVCTT
jgi:hypothetical protein